MKKKAKTTIIAMSIPELNKAIHEAEVKLADWLINRYSKQSKNVREGRILKRKIALLKTVRHIQESKHE